MSFLAAVVGILIGIFMGFAVINLKTTDNFQFILSGAGVGFAILLALYFAKRLPERKRLFITMTLLFILGAVLVMLVGISPVTTMLGNMLGFPQHGM